MKKISLLCIICLLLTGFAACGENPAPQTQPATDLPAITTEPPATTEPPTTEEPATESGPQPMELVGVWQQTHSEVEGDRNPNTQGSLTITGDDLNSLIVTYEDKDFPENNFFDKALTIREDELFPGCGNASWYMEVAPVDTYSYNLTLLEDGTLLLQCCFDFDGMPMVSHMWFARKE